MTQADNLSPEDEQAKALFAKERFAEAEALFRRVVSDFPRNAPAHYNLGVTLTRQDKYEEALPCYETAIRLNPSFADAFANFAFCLCELGFVKQARQGFAIAKQLSPNDPVPALNEGLAALALGDYAAGWTGFSARWGLPSYQKIMRHFDKPLWEGQELNGKTLFLYPEQGFGDTIQMARFIPLLEQRGAKVIVEGHPALSSLLVSASATFTVSEKGEPTSEFDYYSPMMDVPRWLGITLDNLPCAVPYLHADAAAVATRNAAFPKRKRRIGLSWAGRATHQNNRNRSLIFEQIAPLTQRDDIEWVSLQRVMREGDKPVLAASSVLDWGQGFADFAETAAAMETLDLVISIDTAVAHLAGALGKPVWVLLPFYPDWRWLLDREESPWYPTARLFRQKKRRDWDEVISRVAASL